MHSRAPPLSIPLVDCGTQAEEEGNLCNLPELNENSILEALQRRFTSRLPYAFANQVCVAVNPYQIVPFNVTSHSAHVSALSDDAIQGIREGCTTHSIVVNGESGAGKTETIKLLLKYIAHVASSRGRQGQVEEQVMQRARVLERFGNAATARNGNSSCFGAHLLLGMSAQLEIGRIACSTYLLEKSRVVGQGCSALERNFHVFYEILGAPETAKEQLGLAGKTSEDFFYTQHRALSEAQAVQYAAHFADTTRVLDDLLLHTGYLAVDVYKVIAATLHLGELSLFCGDLAQAQHLAAFSKLVGVEETLVEERLCNKCLEVNGMCILSPLDTRQMAAGRDALAKKLYSCLFHWLVAALYEQTSTPQPTQACIGLLDIFGFEDFGNGGNSLEQLCINYTNEVLQLRFAKDVIVSVQAEYAAEGIDWEPVTFTDNETVLELLQGKMGVMRMLDDECVVPGGSDVSLCNKLTREHRRSAAFAADPKNPCTFAVLHYAGSVTYYASSFIEKNRDSLHLHAEGILHYAKDPFVAQLFRESPASSPDAVAGGSKPGRKVSSTICARFCADLDGLMGQINASHVHYVRCIKPNASRSCTEFDRDLVARQLRAGGLVEATRVLRAAYPHKLSHQACYDKCRVLVRAEKQMSCRAAYLHKVLVEQLNMAVRVGATKVYFKAGALSVLMGKIAAVEHLLAVRLQAWLRGRLRNLQFLRLRRAVSMLQRHIRVSLIARSARLRVESAAITVQSGLRRYRSRERFVRCCSAVRLLQEWWRSHKTYCAHTNPPPQMVLLCPQKNNAAVQTEAGWCTACSIRQNRRLEKRQVLENAVAELRACFPSSWDPRHWNNEAQEKLILLVLATGALIAVHIGHGV